MAARDLCTIKSAVPSFMDTHLPNEHAAFRHSHARTDLDGGLIDSSKGDTTFVTLFTIYRSRERDMPILSKDRLECAAIRETDIFKEAVDRYVTFSNSEDGDKGVTKKWMLRQKGGQQDSNKVAIQCFGTLDIRAVHSWKDVMDEVQKAMEKHAQKTKGAIGFAKSVGNSIERHVSDINPWLELLPSGDYSSIVCGGLKLVFGALAAHAMVKSEIIQAMGEIPYHIDYTNLYIDIYKSQTKHEISKVLRTKAIQLYVAILNLIRVILEWLGSPRFKEATKAFIKQDAYSENIEAEIKNVTAKASYFRLFLEYCLHAVAKETNDTTKITLDSTNKTLNVSTETNGIAKDVQNKIDENAIVASATLLNTKAILAQGEKHLEQFKEIFSKAAIAGMLDLLNSAEWRTEMKQAFEEHSYRLEQRRMPSDFTCHASQCRLHKVELILKYEDLRQAMTPPRPRTFVGVQQLRTSLRLDSEALRNSLELIVSAGQENSSRAQQYAYWLMRDQHFRTWLLSNRSQFLLIRSCDVDRLTPLSFFCAILLESLQIMQPAVTAHFYCGIDNPNAASGTLYLLRSLITQLLDCQNLALPSIDPQDYQGIECHNPAHLWNLFRNLVGSLHGATFFCMIDGALRYPDEQEALGLIQALVALTRQLQGNVRLKVLFTSPLSSEAVDIVPEEDMLSMPFEPALNGESMNSRQMAFTYGQG